MSISGINQSLPMPGMQRLNATDISSGIMKKVDTDGDGALNADELNQLGGRGKKISKADTDGDGLVSQNELSARITERIESMGNSSGLKRGISVHGIQRPDVGDISTYIMGKVDTDGDGTLNTEELGQLGGRGKRISYTDTDGDGLVSQDELLSGITEKMKSIGNSSDLKSGQQPDINQIKSMLLQMVEGTNAKQSSADLFTQVLAEMGVSKEDADSLLLSLNNSSFSALV